MEDTNTTGALSQKEVELLIKERNPTLIAEAIIRVIKTLVTEDGTAYEYENGVYTKLHPSFDVAVSQLIDKLFYEKLDHTPHNNLEYIAQLSVTLKREVAFEFKRMSYVPFSMLNKEKCINFKNCLVYITKDGPVVKPHSPEIYSTMQLPWDYKPDAVLGHPKFNSWLTEACMDIDDKEDKQKFELMWQLMAMCIVRNMWGMNIYWQLYGAGGNGKSTFINTLEYVLGKHNISHVPMAHIIGEKQYSSGEYSLYKLGQSLANIDADASHRKRVDMSLLNKLTGGDTIQARQIYKEPIDMEVRCVFVTTYSELPNYDVTAAIARRMQHINMVHQFDSDIAQSANDYWYKFKDEVQSIIHELIKWCCKIESNNGNLINPYTQAQTKLQVSEKQVNILNDIIPSILVPDTNNRMKFAQIADAVKTTLEEQGYDEDVIKSNTNVTRLGRYPLLRDNKFIRGANYVFYRLNYSPEYIEKHVGQ